MPPSPHTPQDVLSTARGIDLIGDVHGHLDPLERLLRQLGYADPGGVWCHPAGRKALFLGDLIDRGPDNIGVVRTVRQMTEAGEAVCLMGNHELNAVLFSREDPASPGRHLRPRTDKNIGQHLAFLQEYHASREARDRMHEDIAWFASLPLWAELEGLRAIHACWSQDHVGRIAHPLRLITPGGEALMQAADAATPLGEAVDVILKGAETPLPDGVSFEDKDGHPRARARIRWWAHAAGWSERVIGPPELLDRLSDLPGAPPVEIHYPSDERPVFFGHYWMTPQDARPMLTRSPNVCCLDFSIARPGGLLAAYRWDGEETLDASRMAWEKR